MRAKKLLQAERKQKEDIGRVKDVIGGWGGESERALRKVAQRGGERTVFQRAVHDPDTPVLLLYNSGEIIQHDTASPGNGGDSGRKL